MDCTGFNFGSALSSPCVSASSCNCRRAGTKVAQEYVDSGRMPKARAKALRPPKCLIASLVLTTRKI